MNQMHIDPGSLRGAMPKIPMRFDELTSARGFAACFVVLYHVNAYSQGTLIDWFPPLHYGQLAVDFFFVLSGFVLTHVYRDAWRNGTYRHGGFILRRFARIWPLQVVTLIGVAAIVLLGTRFGIVPQWQPTVSSFLLNLTMLHATGLTPELAWNQPSWSVSAEWCAYLVFAIFLEGVEILPGIVAKLAAAIGLFVACFALAHLAFGEDLMELTNRVGVLRIVPSFFAGVVLRTVLDRTAAWPVADNARLLTVALWAVLGVALVAAALHAPNAVFWPIIVATILLLALRGQVAAPGWLRARPLVWLGDISYALYLVHAPVLMVAFGVAAKLLAVDSPAGLAAVGAVAFAGALVTAHVAHVLIERPAQNFIVGIGRRRLPAIA